MYLCAYLGAKAQSGLKLCCLIAGRALEDGKGSLADGTQFDRQSGEEHGPNGYWFRWHRLKGKSGKVIIIIIIIMMMIIMMMMIVMVPITITITIMIMIMIVIILKRFDELGTCRTSLVSPEQPILCIPIRPTNTAILTIVFTW